ncbi:hypothetical protein C3B54_111299 [Pontimonas salivibrio]|uniref:Lipoprotein n=1 Tax=Pontimonas salivibrio TaxID=1159327 RepID=A0A2L2BRJ1_9MICO|nr:hypothetical protein [Pontimonas salivibrio]AVG24247.1 hypothetical protein C3B54_111299 [Pontimonas salivibrio]
MTKTFPLTALVGVFVLIVVGCTTQEDPAPRTKMAVEESQDNQGEAEADTGEAEGDKSIGVDEGLLTVDVTIPAEFYEGISEEEIAQSVEEEGYTDFVMNPDGSVTFTMPKAVWDEALREMKADLDASIQEIANEYPEMLKSVTYDNDVTEFELVVDRAAYESNSEAQWLGFGLNFQAQFYQMFAGVPADERGGSVQFIDEATGEVFDSQEWPVN